MGDTGNWGGDCTQSEKKQEIGGDASELGKKGLGGKRRFPLKSLENKNQQKNREDLG